MARVSSRALAEPTFRHSNNEDVDNGEKNY